MFKRKAGIGAQSMPTSEDLAKWGAYELSFEELLEVNGGKRDRSEGRSGGGRSSGSGGSSSRGSSGRGSNKSSGGGVKSKETNKDKRKGSKTHTGSTGTEGKKNGVGGTTGNGLKGGEPKSKEEKKSGSTDYTVREGDTLSGIVRERYPGASKEEIAEKVKEAAKNSGIKDINVIHPGDKIVFEKVTEPSSEAGFAEANTGKEKGSAERTSREGRTSTGSGFLRGGGYRQGVEKSTAGKREQGTDLPQATDPAVPALPEERKGIRRLIDKITNTFFKNDGAKTIYTTGVSASGTVTMVSSAAGAGIYINPKNDNLFNLSTKLLTSANSVAQVAGAALTAANIEDIGGYAGAEAGAGAGVSGSLTATVGSFTSKEDAAGLYYAMGGSGGAEGLSGGGDMVFNMNHKHIGTTGSFGLGVGPSLLEVHTRWGFTGITSFINKNGITP